MNINKIIEEEKNFIIINKKLTCSITYLIRFKTGFKFLNSRLKTLEIKINRAKKLFS